MVSWDAPPHFLRFLPYTSKRSSSRLPTFFFSELSQGKSQLYVGGYCGLQGSKMNRNKSAVPDAWDDDWEKLADVRDFCLEFHFYQTKKP